MIKKVIPVEKIQIKCYFSILNEDIMKAVLNTINGLCFDI